MEGMSCADELLRASYSMTAGHLLGLNLQDMRKAWRAQVPEVALTWNTRAVERELACGAATLSVLSSLLFCSFTFLGYCVFDLHLAARTRLWEEVFQHVPLKLPRPDCESHVSRRHIVPSGEVKCCGIYHLTMKLTSLFVRNHQDYVFLK